MIEKITRFIQTRPKLVIVSGVGFWLAVLVLGTAYHYATTATITIVSDDPKNAISIVKLSTQSAGQNGYGRLTVRVSPGAYGVTVSGRTSTTKKTVTLEARHNQRYAINLRNLSDAEPVLSFGAYGITADNNRLFFVDMRDNLLYQVQSNGPATAVDSNLKFSSVKWHSPGYGVALSLNKDALYTIKDGQVARLKLPFSSGHIDYDFTIDQTLLVTDGSVIYQQLASGNYSKLYSAVNSSIFSLTAGNNRLLVGQNKTTAKTGDDAIYLILDEHGKQLASRTGLSLYNARWSPDGKVLVVSSPSDTTLYGDRFEVVGQLPDKNVLGLAWLDDNTLMYGLGDGLYRYDLGSKTGYQLLKVTGNSGVSGVYPNQDGSQIYFLTEVSGRGNGQAYAVMRASLSTPPNSVVFTIGAFFPLQFDQCTVDFINFIRPAIAITPYGPTVAAGCQQQTKTLLNKAGVAETNYSFYTNIADISD